MFCSTGRGLLRSNAVPSLAGPDAYHVGAGAAQDAVVESPLPGGVSGLVRALFNLPQWLQITLFVLGVLAATALLVLLWRQRRAIRLWIASRPRGTRVWVAVAAAVVVLFGVGLSGASWNYIQHDNGFCTGCHVMGPSFQRFTQSEHRTLTCHDCHQQSMYASMRQLYLWVAERPEDIGPHAKVPTGVCARCHITEQPEVWQRIASTAGHRTHLESDSSALRGVQCVTCHGVEVHRFAPVDSTCGQANCHIGTEIALGAMAEQTALHCVTCHRFTAEVPVLATRDSASGALVPGMSQCLSCHEMRAVLADFDPARDPHGGTCGMCHNPHTQRRAADARTTCTTAGCHAGWRDEPFHTGANHRPVAEQCITCHIPHQARVDASDCAGCHRSVSERFPGRRPLPLPFDTTRALRRTSFLHDSEGGLGGGEPPGDWRGRGGPNPTFHDVASTFSAPPDTFSHDRHRALSCITCHTTGQGRRRLTFEPPRGCQICHHQAPRTSRCADCHDANEYETPQTATVRVSVAGHTPRERLVEFQHATHQGVQCAACHTTPVALGLAPDAATCAACHADHHGGGGRTCAACHGGDAMRPPHQPPAEAHVGCDDCHAPAIVASLVPDRLFCLTCHPRRTDHYADRACTTCHLLATPDEFRPVLSRVDQGAGQR